MSCQNKNCGCTDVGLTTPAPCPCEQVTCATPDICPETFSDSCIIHTGDTIVDLDIKQGDRLATILQKIAIRINQPACVSGTACASALGFKSTLITNNSIKVAWDTVTGSTGYVVQYRKTTASIWTSNPSVTTGTDTITGLDANTNYYIRVNTVCGVTKPCFSVTLLITTKS